MPPSLTLESTLTPYQTPKRHLDRLSAWRIRRARLVRKRRMGSQPCLVDIRVKTPDEHHLVRGLIGQVIPLVFRIISDIVGPAFALRVNHAYRDQIYIDVDGAEVHGTKRATLCAIGLPQKVSTCRMRSRCIGLTSRR